MTSTRSIPAERSVACAINRAAGGQAVPGNQAHLLIDGPLTYRAMLDAIGQATRWIHFENYIIRSDEAGLRFAELLAARARDGIHVRVLYDWLGSIGTTRKFWKRLRSAGVEVRPFNPPRLIDAMSNFSRNHRKLVVADGSRAVLGGLCIGCEWTGEGTAGSQPWRDTAVDITGPAAASLDQTFASAWELAGGKVPPDEVAGSVPPQGTAAIRVISGEPGRERAYRVIELLLAGSVERLWITDAYLLAPPRLFQALRESARDGVDVRLLVPGSSNLNPSSLLGNYELDVLIDDAGLADAMRSQFRRDIARSREVTSRRARGPRRISRALPVALTYQEPEVPATYRRTRRERRQRAVVALRAVASHARRSVFGPVSAIFLALCLLFVALPRESAYVLAALCAWLALGAGREALRRRVDR